jgi:hypothetical protein
MIVTENLLDGKYTNQSTYDIQKIRFVYSICERKNQISLRKNSSTNTATLDLSINKKS